MKVRWNSILFGKMVYIYIGQLMKHFSRGNSQCIFRLAYYEPNKNYMDIMNVTILKEMPEFLSSNKICSSIIEWYSSINTNIGWFFIKMWRKTISKMYSTIIKNLIIRDWNMMKDGIIWF